MKPFIIFVVIIFSISCFQLFDCGEEIVSEIVSPDGAYTVTLFERNCGATTEFVYHLNLRDSKENFKKDDLNRIEEGYIPTPNSKEKLEINWVNSKELQIKCPTCYSIQNTNWKDIKINYTNYDK